MPDVYDPHVYVGIVAETVTDFETSVTTTTYTYWIMAYYLEDEPAAKMLDVIAQPLVDPLIPLQPTQPCWSRQLAR